MPWHQALRNADLADNSFIGICVDARHVLVSRRDGELHAVTNVCPHNGTLLSGGVVKGGCISCPGHFWRFDLATGQKQGDPNTALTTYPTQVRDGWIEIDLPEPTSAKSLREILLASARGEDVKDEVSL